MDKLKKENYRKLVVRILLSLPNWLGVLEFMDFIYCVETGEGENQHMSKLKLLWTIYSLIQRLIALLQVSTGQPPSRLDVPKTMTFSMLDLTSFLRHSLVYMVNKFIFGSHTSLVAPYVSPTCQTCREATALATEAHN